MFVELGWLFVGVEMATAMIAADIPQLALEVMSSFAGCCNVQASDLSELLLLHAERVKTLSHRQCWRESTKVEMKRGNSMRILIAGEVVSSLLRDVLRVPKMHDEPIVCYLLSLMRTLRLHWPQLKQDDGESHRLKRLSLTGLVHL